MLALLAIAVLLGSGLRLCDLGTESLGEDELNKLQTVAEYRENGLSGKNGEHPFLMKGLQTLSISAAEKAAAAGILTIREEAALRLPVAIAGTLSIIFLFLLVTELFGPGLGIVSALFWAVEPVAIGFDRIAKEDSMVLCFFLLAGFFWVRSQTKAQLGERNWTYYVWAAGAAFAGLMASKYYPHLLAILAGYYIVFQYIPSTKWRMESVRWLKFMVVMGTAFLILNPTIVLPDTWREMLKFSTEKRIGHDSYEFWGALYTNKMSAWLSGVPWTFYYVFLTIKSSFPIFVLFLIGLPLMFRRKMGDGRFFIFFWAFFWFLPFTFLGGKFTRYSTFVEPLIIIAAATAFCFITGQIARFIGSRGLAAAFQGLALAAVVGTQFANSYSSSPNFRLFTNSLAPVFSDALIFPHDEVYDLATREIAERVAATAKPNAVVASETPGLFEHYSAKTGRSDISFISLSDKLRGLSAGDVVAAVEGRRYFSNSEYLASLKSSGTQPVTIERKGIVVARIYTLTEADAAALRAIAER